MRARDKWLGLIADILLYELTADEDELLSDYCYRLVQRHPVAARVFIASTGALLTLHLAALIDRRHDPIAKTFWRR